MSHSDLAVDAMNPDTSTPTTHIPYLANVNKSVHSAEANAIAIIAGLTDPLDAVVVHQRLSDIVGLFRHLTKLAEERAVELIGPGSVTVGDIKYWTGHDKTVKCNDQRATLERALQLAAGDVDTLANGLSSGAIKYGWFRKLLEEHGGNPAEYDRHFTTTTKDTLESGEKLPKRLISADTKYL